jgi:glycosyltransferase involved in cell wall biosynthesis
MNNKKILILAHGFFPENSPRSHRATELAKELVKQGHFVKVITHKKKGTEEFCIENGIQFKDLGQLSWPIPTIKGNGITKLFWRAICRFSNLWFEYPLIELIPLVRKAVKGESGYDAIISIAYPYPIHWGLASVWNKKDKIAKIWIADCGDPYVGRENDTFKVPFYFEWIEKWLFRKTDYITVPTQGAIEGYYKEFHQKIKVISQGFNFEDVKLFDGEKETEKIIFGYGGLLIPGKRDPSDLLNFLNTLDAKYNFEFHFYTSSTQLIEPFLGNSSGRIQLKEMTDRMTLLFEMSKMNFVVNIENEGTSQTPSKLIDFVIIKKPILSVKFGELNTQTVLEFLDGNYENALKIADPDQYKIENVAKKFLNLLENN